MPGIGLYEGSCAQTLFERQAAQQPNATAILFEGTRISYQELNEASNRLAHYLVDRLSGCHKLVGLYLPSSPETLISAMAVLKSGAAIVPLDISDPWERTGALIAEAGVPLVLAACDPKVISGANYEWLSLSTGICKGKPECNPDVAVKPSDTACLLFTSGSTGRPKAVIRLHRAIVHRLQWAAVQLHDVYCHNMPLTVGLSLERLFLPLMCGASLLIVRDDSFRDASKLVTELEWAGVTHVTLVPPMLRQLLALKVTTLRRLSCLRTIAVGGAPLTRDLVQTFARALPNIQLINAYGSTESGSVIRGPVDLSSPLDLVPIGKAVPGAQAYIVGADGKLVPAGEPGELWVSGPCLARGYLEQPDLTATKFCTNPFEDHTSVSYKTGDIARLLPDGEIVLLHRADRQVKVRGYRVELGEIEATLLQHDQVKEAVVVQIDDGRLGAYVVSKSPRFISTRELRTYLIDRLPTYMVPALLVLLDALPVTPSGKINVSLLPNPMLHLRDTPKLRESPQNTVETKLAHIWQELLGADVVGVTDTFYALGGDSLLAVKVQIAVMETFAVEISSPQIANRSIRDLALLIETLLEREMPPSKINPAPLDTEPPIGICQELFLISELRAMAQLRSNYHGSTGFGFLLKGEVRLDALQYSLDQVLDRHQILRTSFTPFVRFGALRLEGWDAVVENMPRLASARVQFNAAIQPAARLEIVSRNIESLTDTEKEEMLEKAIVDAISTPYDYSKPPLMRATLLTINAKENLLLLGASHLIFDGQSRSVFQRELVSLYNSYLSGVQNPLSSLRIQFADFAYWQRQTLQGGRLEDLVEYWSKKYETFVSLTIDDFSVLQKQSRVQTGNRGAVKQATLDRSIYREIQNYSSRLQSSVFAFVLSAISIVFHLYTGRRRFGVGTYMTGRTHADVQDLIGSFSTAVMLGLEFLDGVSSAEIVSRTASEVVDTNAHQDLTHGLWSSLISARLKHNKPFKLASPNSVISVEFLQEPQEDKTGRLSITRFGLLDWLGTLPSPKPFRVLAIEAHNESLRLAIAYHTRLFESATMDAMLEDIQKVICYLLAEPNGRIISLRSKLKNKYLASNTKSF